MARCAGIKPDGRRCRAEAMGGSAWCWSHNPDHADARRRRASKGGKRGGRGRPLTELGEVKGRLRKLAEDVIAGDADRGDAAVAGQLYGTYIRALSVELKVREQGEILERIAALEAAQPNTNTRGYGWPHR